MNTSLALSKTDAQYVEEFERTVASAFDDYHRTFVNAEHIHTDVVRSAQFRWYALNRIKVELFWLRSGGRDKVAKVAEQVFVAEEWMHECVRTSKRDGIPTFDGRRWFCSRCESGYYVNVDGCSREAAERMFWSYLANNSFRRR